MSARTAAAFQSAAGSPIDTHGKSREPFKTLTAANIRRLCRELSPAALKVWLYHFSRSGRADTSFPKLETIASGTDLNLQTVKLARRQLVETRWLVKVGQERLGVRLSVPVFRCAIPQRPGPRWVENPPSVKPTLGGNSTPARWVENPPTGVDSEFEVDVENRRRLNAEILTDDDKLSNLLLEKFKNCPEYPGLTREHIAFAIVKIRGRAKTPPGSLAYWLIAVGNFLRDFKQEDAAHSKSLALMSEASVGMGPVTDKLIKAERARAGAAAGSE